MLQLSTQSRSIYVFVSCHISLDDIQIDAKEGDQRNVNKLCFGFTSGTVLNHLQALSEPALRLSFFKPCQPLYASHQLMHNGLHCAANACFPPSYDVNRLTMGSGVDHREHFDTTLKELCKPTIPVDPPQRCR